MANSINESPDTTINASKKSMVELSTKGLITATVGPTLRAEYQYSPCTKIYLIKYIEPQGARDSKVGHEEPAIKLIIA